MKVALSVPTNQCGVLSHLVDSLQKKDIEVLPLESAVCQEIAQGNLPKADLGFSHLVTVEFGKPWYVPASEFTGSHYNRPVSWIVYDYSPHDGYRTKLTGKCIISYDQPDFGPYVAEALLA